MLQASNPEINTWFDFDFVGNAPLPALSPSVVIESKEDNSNLTFTAPQVNLRREPPAKKTKRGHLPTHMLAQHFSQKLASKYSFKSPDWNYYTYFFHRFTRSHPWVLSSMLSWSSASLCFSSKAGDLDDSLQHYSDCLSHMQNEYGFTPEDLERIWPCAYDPIRDDAFVRASADDMDAIFVGYFFLALSDLMAARSAQFRNVLRFIAHLLRIPKIKSAMEGVRSRVATWVCFSSESSFSPML